jgi:hypothetical protein
LECIVERDMLKGPRKGHLLLTSKQNIIKT